MNHSDIESLIGLESPWCIRAMHLDKSSKTVEISVGKKSLGWLRGGRSSMRLRLESAGWQHKSLGDWRCKISVDKVEPIDLPEADWSGPLDSPFTHAMGAQVMAMVGEGMTLGSIAKLLGIEPESMIRFKRRMESGFSQEVTQLSLDDHRNDNLPPVEDPVWGQLLGGERSIEMNNLALKLLFTRLRDQYQRCGDENTRNLKVAQLRNYFDKNTRAAATELQQIQQLASP